MSLGIDISTVDTPWYLFGAPAEILDAFDAEAETRNDPLLKMWIEGQRSERTNHEHYERHGSFTNISAEQLSRPYALRREAVTRYAFSVTHLHALTAIGEFVGEKGLVSLGAGTGWWENRLSIEAGVNVIAYDLHPPGAGDNHWYANVEPFFDVRVGGVKVLREHAERTLFLSWPPYRDPFARQALSEYERAGGSRLIYVGEELGGCCANDKFFGAVDLGMWDDDLPRRGRWTVEREIGVPQWMGIHDAIWCLRRVG